MAKRDDTDPGIVCGTGFRYVRESPGLTNGAGSCRLERNAPG